MQAKFLNAVAFLLALGFAWAPAPLEAGPVAQSCAPIKPTQEGSSIGSYRVNYFTNYSPSEGGINGSCGKSASGKDACQYFLEDYLSGQASAVMIAIPQYDCPPEGFRKIRIKGTKSYRKVACRSRCPGFYNPDMFGGLYRSEEFELSLRLHGVQASCVPLAAADRYAKSESCKSKIDMVTERPVSRLSGIINNIRNTQLYPIGRAGNIKPPVRRVDRDPAAIAELKLYDEAEPPIPRRRRASTVSEPAMNSKEEDESQATAAAAAALYYNTYEAQRNKAMLERSRREKMNNEILQQFDGQQKLNQPAQQPASGVSGE